MPETVPVLYVEALRLAATSKEITTTVAKQQVVGLAGLDGHGQDAFIQALAGLYTPHDGQVLVDVAGTRVAVTSHASAAKSGLAYLPSDRKKNGIFPMLGVADNFLLGSAETFAPHGWINRSQVRGKLERFRADLSMSFASYQTPIRNLSGGNQQKVLLARIMAANPNILLLNDPTRGVDIQTRHSLYDYFRRAVADLGMTIILLSTELDELVELCDRVLVFREDSLFAELDREDLSLDHLMQAMFGQTSGEAA